jgi:hypothetical protein
MISCCHFLEYVIPGSRHQFGTATGEVSLCQRHIESGLFERLVMSEKETSGLNRALGTQALLLASLGMFEVVNAIGSAIKAVVIVHIFLTNEITGRGFITDTE